MNHENGNNLYIKAEDRIFCFYPGINIFWSYYNHHDHHRETVFQCEGVQRLLK